MKGHLRWVAFLVGVGLGIPLASRAGGDFCEKRSNHQDVLVLDVVSLSVDGAEQPVGQPKDDLSLGSAPRDRALGLLADPLDPTGAPRITHLRRLP